MDRPDESDTPVLIALTEDERLHGLELFSDEPPQVAQLPKDESQTYERVPAYAGRIARSVPPVQPEPWNSQVWQARRWAAVLTAIVVVYTATIVLLIRTTPGGQPAPPAVVALPSSVPLPVTDVPSEKPETRPIPPAREAPRVRPHPLIQTASVSSPRTAERPAISASAIRPPVATSPLPPAVPVEPRPVAAVPATLPRAEASVVSAPRVPAPETAIQTVLSRYRTAYRELDAGAARAVWPSVNTKALRKAFDSLEQQDLIFDSCQIAVSDSRAVASCNGFAWYVPRVGNKGPHDDQRQWQFTLNKVDDAWLIETVSAR